LLHNVEPTGSMPVRVCTAFCYMMLSQLFSIPK
jgi:hypothetical protein